MIMTPQARRRITGAVEAFTDVPSRNRWGAWAKRAASYQTRLDVPYDIAAIALEALAADERRIEECLNSVALDEDSEADLLNDLGYIQAIEAAFRKEGVGK